MIWFTEFYDKFSYTPFRKLFEMHCGMCNWDDIIRWSTYNVKSLHYYVARLLAYFDYWWLPYNTVSILCMYPCVIGKHAVLHNELFCVTNVCQPVKSECVQ